MIQRKISSREELEEIAKEIFVDQNHSKIIPFIQDQHLINTLIIMDPNRSKVIAEISYPENAKGYRLYFYYHYDDVIQFYTHWNKVLKRKLQQK